MMGNRLKEVLEREEVTAYRLWKDLGIDRGQLSKFFSGKVNISLELLERIADYLQYDLVLLKRVHPKKGGKKNGDNLQAKKRVLDKVLSKR
jgi:transcriptional regulator with XRE-family HTH domain